jgi:hypothetical protein
VVLRYQRVNAGSDAAAVDVAVVAVTQHRVEATAPLPQ